MSAIVTTLDDGQVASLEGSDDTCRVVVLYEDASARIKTMQMSERLVERFGDDLDFEFSWLKFKRLADPPTAQRVIVMASNADIVMFCTHGDDLSQDAIAWLDKWTASGKNSDGAIALLFAEPFSASASFGALQFRLEKAAVRLGMDFLPLILPALTTSDIQGQQPHISPTVTHFFGKPQHHWGLNE